MTKETLTEEEYINKSNTLAHENKFEEALSLAHAMIEQKPNFSRAYMNKAWFLEQNFNKPKEAALYYALYNSLEEDNTPACFEHDYTHGKALFAMNENFLKTAENVLKTSKIKEELFHAYEQKALNLSSLGRVEEALAAAESFIHAFNKDYNPYAVQGEILYKAGKYTDALISLDKAIAIDKKFHIAHKYKGLCLYALEHYEEALASFNKSLKDEIYEDVQRDRIRVTRKLNAIRGLNIKERHLYQLMLAVLDKNEEEASIKVAIEEFNISKERVQEIENLLKNDVKK